MGTGYTKGLSQFVDGETIEASDFTTEFGLVDAAFETGGHQHDGTDGEGGAIEKLLSNTITFGTGADTDIAVTFDGNSSDGVLTWKEDEDYFEFSDDILIASTEKIQFGDTASFIQQSSNGVLRIDGEATIDLNASTAVTVSNDLKLDSDSAVLGFGADNDTTLTHTDGTGLTLNSTNKLTFGDAASFIQQSGDGILRIDGEATIDLNASTAVTVSNDLKLDSDSAVLGFGADNDTTLTHTDGTGLTLNSTNKLTFGDAASFIQQSGDGVLRIDGEATIDLNASTAVTVSHDLKLDSDGAILGFGADNDITLTHTADTGLTCNGTITATGFTIGSAAITETELEILDGASVTTAELNIIDGNTSATSTAVADADRVVLNDDGTMVQVAVTDLAAYFDDEITAMPNLVSTGALDTGSITSGFGAIDNGTSGIRTNTFTAETSFVPDAADGATLGSASLEFSDLFLADGGQILFGNDQEITLTHVADSGLTLKHAATADDKFPTLTLAAGDTDIAANDKLGVINFQAPDEGTGSDAQEVAAGIEAISEGDFSATANATSLAFKTASDAAATEKMRIDSTGRLNVGANSSTSVAGMALKVEATGNVQQLLKAGTNFNSAIMFGDQDSNTSGEITYAHNGDRMEFDVNGGKKMEIDSKGQVAISGSSTSVDTTPSTNGLQLYFKDDVGAAVVGSASDSTLGNIIFQTSPSGGGAMQTSFTVNAVQNIVMAAGKGIDFANNAHPTGMSSELFDDYEEGTFTGTLGGATSDPSTAVTATGTYTKIGRLVYAAVGFTNVNTTGASGMIQVSGWPHNSTTTMPSGDVMFYNVSNVRTDTANISAFWANSTLVRFYQTLQGTNIWVAAEHAAGTGRYLYVSVTYETS